MPYINIKLAGTLNRDQKETIAKEITTLMEKVAHKPVSYTYIVFDEVKGEDWSVGGSLLG
jgi:4-oxalocrotonate tautomerase